MIPHTQMAAFFDEATEIALEKEAGIVGDMISFSKSQGVRKGVQNAWAKSRGRSYSRPGGGYVVPPPAAAAKPKKPIKPIWPIKPRDLPGPAPPGWTVGNL